MTDKDCPYWQDIVNGQIHYETNIRTEYWIARAAARRVACAFLQFAHDNYKGDWEKFRALAAEVAPD